MLKSILLFILVGYGALAAFALLTADRQIFLPPRSSYRPGDLPIVQVPTTGGAALAVLHLPNPNSPWTILFSHGNAEDLGHLAPLLLEIRESGFGVLAWDYRGYGLSSRTLTTADQTYDDVAAVYRYATRTLRVEPSRIILYGRSVGSGPATHLAAREPVGGLVLESAFTSAFVVVTRIPILPFDRFPNLREIRRVRCPVLILHGLDDRIVPVRHGRRLFEAAPEPKLAAWIEGAGHNDLLLVAGQRYWRALAEFRDLLERRSANDGG